MNRRDFLAGATAAGVVLANAAPASAQTSTGDQRVVLPPGAEQLEREVGTVDDYTSEEVDRYFVSNPGSDFMVDVIKSLEIDYIAVEPGLELSRASTSRLVNYGGNSKPELL